MIQSADIKSSKITVGKGLRAGPTARQDKQRNQQTGSNKTATNTQKEAQYILHEDKLVTPKRLLTAQHIQIQNTLFEVTKKSSEDSKIKSPIASVTDEEQNKSSQMISSVISESRSENGSESDAKKDSQRGEKRKNERKDDPEDPISISLKQTATTIFLVIPSALCPADSPELQRNKLYNKYVQDKIGSDNYVKRPIQTFNFQPKLQSPQVDRASTADKIVQAAYWDILDSFKVQQKTQFQIIQEDIKNNTQKNLQLITSNPFSMLFIENQAINIHNLSEVPGTSELAISKDPKSRNIVITQSLGGSSGQQTRNQLRSKFRGQIQKQIQQNNVIFQKNQKQFFNEVLNKIKDKPSLSEKKVMENQSLQTNLKFVQRILNNITYHKQYILYRNYPEVKAQKIFGDDDPNRRKRNIVQEKQQQQVKFEHLQFLFKFNCQKTQGNCVSSADWNPVNKDLLAVSYGDLQLTSQKEGLLAFWTLKNPSYPQRIIQSPSRMTFCKFSNQNPHLIACGTYDGVVAIYDIRKKQQHPVAQNREMQRKHHDVVWQVQWISKGKSNDKGQSLVSISADDRITQWSMKKGLQYTNIMQLKRITPTSKKQTSSESMNFRQAAGLSFQFLKGQTSMYLASTDQGTIHRCSKSYVQQYLDTYFGHTGPVYRVRCNPFFSDIFLTCSADWSCKLWNWRKDQPMNTFQSLDLHDEVLDIQWSPDCSTLFCSVCKDGRIQLWDLAKKNMLDPICIVYPDSKQQRPKTMVRFCKGSPVLVTGDSDGDVNVYRLHDYQDNNPLVQQQRLVKLLYPGGYSKGTYSYEESVEERSQ